MRILSIISLIILLTQSTWAQDVHFSSPYGSTLTTNPAMAGNYSGDYRFSNTFRSQWFNVTKPYSTLALQYDRQFYYRNDAFGAGCVLLKDDSGYLGLNSFSATLQGSYRKNINKHSTIIGVQFGYGVKYFNPDMMTLPDQFDHSIGYFNSQMETQENLKYQMIQVLNLNTGILWHYQSDRFSPEFGIAAYNLNRPSESFQNTRIIYERFNSHIANGLAMRYVVHASFEYVAGSNVAFKPYLRYMRQNSTNQVLAGCNSSYVISEEKKIQSVNMGIYIRKNTLKNSDAVIATCGVNTKKMSMQIAYDINISDLHIATKYQGAFEISFIYKGISTFLCREDNTLIRF